MFGSGRIEDLVLAGNLKTLHLLEGCVTPVVVLQMDEDGIVLDIHIFIGGTLILDSLIAIVTVKCREGKTLTHRLFLGRMNLVVS